MITKFKIFEKVGDTVIDYKGNEIPLEDAVWCEYDKEWCLKKDAIWIDYTGFYTIPEIPKDRIKPKTTFMDRIKWWKNGKLEEGIRWYNKGKLEPNDEPLEIFEFPVFEVGDRISAKKCIFWFDLVSGSRENTSIKNKGKWDISRASTIGEVESIDYCNDVDGYTGQIIQLKEPYWPWFQTTGFKKISYYDN